MICPPASGNICNVRGGGYRAETFTVRGRCDFWGLGVRTIHEQGKRRIEENGGGMVEPSKSGSQYKIAADMINRYVPGIVSYNLAKSKHKMEQHMGFNDLREEEDIMMGKSHRYHGCPEGLAWWPVV